MDVHVEVLLTLWNAIQVLEQFLVAAVIVRIGVEDLNVRLDLIQVHLVGLALHPESFVERF